MERILNKIGNGTKIIREIGSGIGTEFIQKW